MTSIDIAKDKISGKCDLKCAYNFKYNSTNLVATNKSTYIQLDCDKDNVAPVTYNNEKYMVSDIKLYVPSLQLYNGKKAVAELIIGHKSDTGNKILAVCIPFVQSNDSNSASVLMSGVLAGIISGAPANGNKTVITISNFTLQDIVPRKPFYNYTVSQSYDVITFDTLYAIPIDSSTLAKLKNIIKPDASTIQKTNIFYNEKGPNSSLANEGIYISCNPTGSSDETVEVAKNPMVNDLSSAFNDSTVSTIIQLAVMLFLFIVIYFGFNFLYNNLFVKKTVDFNLQKASSS